MACCPSEIRKRDSDARHSVMGLPWNASRRCNSARPSCLTARRSPFRRRLSGAYQKMYVERKYVTKLMPEFVSAAAFADDPHNSEKAFRPAAKPPCYFPVLYRQSCPTDYNYAYSVNRRAQDVSSNHNLARTIAVSKHTPGTRSLHESNKTTWDQNLGT